MSAAKLRPSFTLAQDRLDELKAVVPEAFADGTLDWDTLKEALGSYLADEAASAEHFGLTWPGKRAARRLAASPSKGTLAPLAGQGVDEHSTRNLFIEGDNLEVLKLLQKSYAGRIKMIYIDPPYNTGNDFVYNDNYRDSPNAYLRKSGKMDEAGNITTTNTRSGGRFHSNWLSMMYPRLILARQLLSEDGMIFVSIDDNEQHNLKSLMAEIFGEENFLATIIWEKVYSPRMDTEGFSVSHDYLLVFGKTLLARPNRTIFEQNQKQFSYYDEKKQKYYRRRSVRKEGKDSLRADVPSMFFPLEAPDGTLIYPIKPNGTEGRWRWSLRKYQTELDLGNVEWVKVNGVWQVYAKQYLDSTASKPPATLWGHLDAGHNHEANAEIAALLGPRVFDTPKPTRLIKKAMQIATRPQEEAIVLDFFAGSGTTAHAVLDLNHEDGGRRQFICVQIPEPIDNPDFPTIAEIGKERIRRAIAKIRESARGRLDLQPRATPEDLGFKVYTLARSNYKAWQDYAGNSVEEIETLFDRIETPLVEDWGPEDLLTEILLLQGFPLDSVVTPQPAFTGNKVLRIESGACAHQLIVCLDTTIAGDTIERLRLRPEDIFVCLDSALTDQAKLRLSDICNLSVI